jgi:hypothetical protein
MTVKFDLDGRKVPSGTVLLFGIAYEREPRTPDETRGVTEPKVFTYAMLKAGPYWYVTGTGQTPQAAGWGAVQKWLAKDNRVVKWVEVATGRERLWPAPEPATSTD